MGEGIVGRPVNAVLGLAQAERFAAVAGADLDRLVLNVTGWNKLVMLEADRVFLFPRSALGVEWFERELAACRALAQTELSIVPRLLGRPGRAAAWADLLAAAAQLRPVLVHGDIHGGQLLTAGGRLTGIIDWETARVDHPFWDLDPGQWGAGLRQRRSDLSALRARHWRAYAQARGLDADSGPVETAFGLRHALGLLTDPGDPAVIGTIQEQLAQL